MTVRVSRLVLFAVFVALSLAGVEIVLRTFPRLLPLSYRAALPLRGMGLGQPGVLQRTPIDEVPLPYRLSVDSDYDNPPPQDLQAMGLVGRDQNPDRERYGNVVLRTDAQGLPNETVLEDADVLLVGDSFALAAAVLSPAGLQKRLAQVTGLSIYNLGVPAIGPRRELFVLREVGLAKRPAAVIWLFFGGNDVQDAGRLADHLARGVETYADLLGSGRPPSLLFDLFRRGLQQRSADAQRQEPRRQVPPFIFHSREGPVPIWFSPSYLRNLARTEAEWRADPGWKSVERVLDELASFRDLGINTLLTYVPAKPEVYLRHVDKDAALLQSVASWDQPAPLEGDPEELWRSAIANRNSLDRVLQAAAAARDIDYLSLNPVLDAIATEGGLGFLQADTHWGPEGQQAAVEPLASWLGDAL